MTGRKSLGLLGKKLGMTQIFQEDGTCVPVTIVQAGPCRVMQVKMVKASEHPEGYRSASINRGKKSGRTERARAADGYYAVQVGFDDKPSRLCTKAELGNAKKAGLEGGKRLIKEFRLDAAPKVVPGEDITVALLEDVTHVDVTGTTKGRGWSGTIRRWNFHRQDSTHGNSRNTRRAGGIGRQYSTSHGVPKGKKMAGQYGVEQVTIQRIKVVKVDNERNLVYLHGAVPGHVNAYVTLNRTVKNERDLSEKPGMTVSNAAAKALVAKKK
ncbi:MAG: 50S ribosomal protein L3 [Planctomycetes bacterium]|nr:50S ribosomal protein L3 [Planctomycetota bacterium]